MENYGLDMHCSMILDEYRELLPTLKELEKVIDRTLHGIVADNGIYVNAIEHRIKAEKSLAGKLELKGHKYESAADITDLIGARVITFYSDEVDKIAAIVGKTFTIDWENSIDKRKMHELDSFGYNSLHYICQVPKSMYYDAKFPRLNEIRFEIQMRTALQHVWAVMDHDTGYKSGVEIPKTYLRNLNRLAGMLELADEQFSNIRTEINDYRRQVQGLVASGHFDEVVLDGDTYKSYLKLEPFDALNKRIAAINQAEIYTSSLLPFLPALKGLGFSTLGDLDRLIKDYTETAYHFAVYELGNTDIDIISSTIGLLDLLIVYIIGHGGTADHLRQLFDGVFGKSEYNAARAEKAMENAKKLGIKKKKRS